MDVPTKLHACLLTEASMQISRFEVEDAYYCSGKLERKKVVKIRR